MYRTVRTLKSKLLFAVLPALTVLTILTVWLVSSYVRSSFQKDFEQQQMTLVSLMARKLDDQFATYQRTITTFAKQVPHADLHNPKALEHFIDSRPALREMFDNNVVIFSPQGVLLAESAQRPSRTGTDYSYRDYIIKTQKNWQPVISKPFRSTLPNAPPVVMFTVPVRDVNGKPLAIVGGSINLLRPNLLGALATTRIGTSGYFYLSDSERTMIMHPDPDRLMKPVTPAGVNRLYDRAVEGFEGAGTTVNSRGVEMLVAYKRLATTNWILAAQLTTVEAFASVNAGQKIAWSIAVVALVTLGLLIVVAASRLLAPLQNLTAQIASIGYDNNDARVVVSTDDEIGELGKVFNSMLRQLQAREREVSNSRDLYQFIADFSQDWIFWRTATGEMLYISPAAERITGYPVLELMADPSLIDAMIYNEDRNLWQEHLCKADQGGQNDAIEYRIINRFGEEHWISHTCLSIFDDAGNLLGVRGSNRDITERKAALLLLNENEKRLQLIASAAHDAIIMFNQHRLITFWNPAAETLFGALQEQALQMPIETFLPGLMDAVHLAGGIPDAGFTLELSGNHQHGHHLPMECAISRARLGGNHYTLLLARDITERKQSEEKLKYISSHDALTGLYNRAGYDYHLSRLDREGPFPVAVIIADLDGLKTVNDSQGHEAGDQLLQAAADLLASSFRGDDIVARIGGDEFAVLLPGIPADVARNKYERMLRRIDIFSEVPENPDVLLSCGMAYASGPGCLADAVKQADQLMYQQKFVRKNPS